MDAIIEDFEDRARVIHSDWVFKPGADRDLIVRRNASDTNLSRVAAKGKMRHMTEDQVTALLQCLNKVLEDVSCKLLIAPAKTKCSQPYQLARASDSFQLTSAASAGVSVSAAASVTVSGPQVKRIKPNTAAGAKPKSQPL